MRQVTTFLLLLSMLLLTMPRSDAMQTDNHGINVVPAPAKVTIDGRLRDWDLSGQILICYDTKTLKDIYSGRVAMMYDKDNFYIAIHWKDPIPMGNSHHPKFQGHRGWAGDCVQFRVRTDMTMHVDCWFSAVTKKPVLSITYGRFSGGRDKVEDSNLFVSRPDALADGAREAFRMDEDKRGYVQEIALPWKLITGQAAIVKKTGKPYKAPKAYGAGESFRCGIELLWGEADWPVHRYADNLADGTTSREFFWTAEQAWGTARLREKGKLRLPMAPWEKALAEERPEGPIKIPYRLPKNARVTLAIDDLSGKRIRNLLPAAERKKGKNVDLWDGLDDDGQVVKPGSYRVKGLYHDGLRLTYAHSYASPGNPGWGTADGKGAFYGDHTPPEAVAAGKDRIALACPMGEAGKHLIAVDMKGQRQWGVGNRAAFGGGRISLATDGKILFVANVDGRNGRFTIWRCFLKDGRYAPWNRKDKTGKAVLDLEIMAKNGMANCRAIAWHDGKLALILAAEKRLLILDADKGKILKNWQNMPAGMSSVAFDQAGRLLLTTAKSVYVVHRKSGRPRKLISGLDEATGITTDAKSRIYVGQRGKQQNVEIFNAKGKKLGRIGKPGGRPAHEFFDARGMRDPSQIAIDSKGRLWVTEGSHQPKRTSVWRPNGKLAFDLVGTTAYAAGGLINPYDHTRGISEWVEYKLDFKKQTYRPLYTLPDALGTGMGWVTKIARVNGREYAQARHTARDASMVKLFMRKRNGSWQHVAEWGNVGLGRSMDEPYHKKWNRKFAGPLWDGLFGKAFLWIDTNGDGKAQREEIQTRANLPLGVYYWGQAMGDDLTIPVPVRGKGILLFKPQGFTAKGVPRYDFDSAELIKPNVRFGGEGMMALGRDGRIYLNQGPLCAIDKAGKVLWTYPNKHVSVHGSHHAGAGAPGYLIGPSSIYGTAYINREIGEVFYLNGNLGENFIFTEDGLWVQKLYNDCRGWYDVPAQATVGMPCDAMSAGGESFGGSFCKSDNGKYYTIGGGTAAVVMEISGLDSMKRFGLKVRVTPRDIVAAQELKVKRASQKMARKVYAIKAVAEPMATTGDLKPWAMAKNAIEIQSGRHKIGRIKAAYDKDNLYLAYQVNDRSPMQNAGQDEKLMFITGDCVDLMLRTNRKAKSAKPIKGDLRLLMTVKGDRPLAVIYRPVVPGTAKTKRIALSSPWRSVWFDEIKVAEFPLAMKPISGGYAVTAAVPLKLLGLTSLKGKTLRGDFGILGSDSGGRECTSRHYWCNKTTNNTNDVPDEAIITPALWGELRFQ